MLPLTRHEIKTYIEAFENLQKQTDPQSALFKILQILPRIAFGVENSVDPSIPLSINVICSYGEFSSDERKELPELLSSLSDYLSIVVPDQKIQPDTQRELIEIQVVDKYTLCKKTQPLLVALYLAQEGMALWDENSTQGKKVKAFLPVMDVQTAQMTTSLFRDEKEVEAFLSVLLFSSLSIKSEKIKGHIELLQECLFARGAEFERSDTFVGLLKRVEEKPVNGFNEKSMYALQVRALCENPLFQNVTDLYISYAFYLDAWHHPISRAIQYFAFQSFPKSTDFFITKLELEFYSGAGLTVFDSLPIRHAIIYQDKNEKYFFRHHAGARFLAALYIKGSLSELYTKKDKQAVLYFLRKKERTELDLLKMVTHLIVQHGKKEILEEFLLALIYPSLHCKDVNQLVALVKACILAAGMTFEQCLNGKNELGQKLQLLMAVHENKLENALEIYSTIIKYAFYSDGEGTEVFNWIKNHDELARLQNTLLSKKGDELKRYIAQISKKIELLLFMKQIIKPDYHFSKISAEGIINYGEQIWLDDVFKKNLGYYFGQDTEAQQSLTLLRKDKQILIAYTHLAFYLAYDGPKTGEEIQQCLEKIGSFYKAERLENLKKVEGEKYDLQLHPKVKTFLIASWLWQALEKGRKIYQICALKFIQKPFSKELLKILHAMKYLIEENEKYLLPEMRNNIDLSYACNYLHDLFNLFIKDVGCEIYLDEQILLSKYQRLITLDGEVIPEGPGAYLCMKNEALEFVNKLLNPGQRLSPQNVKDWFGVSSEKQITETTVATHKAQFFSLEVLNEMYLRLSKIKPLIQKIDQTVISYGNSYFISSIFYDIEGDKKIFLKFRESVLKNSHVSFAELIQAFLEISPNNSLKLDEQMRIAKLLDKTLGLKTDLRALEKGLSQPEQQPTSSFIQK